MSQIYISKDAIRKLRDSQVDETTVILLSKFNPDRREKYKYKSLKAKRDAERIREMRKIALPKENGRDEELCRNRKITLSEYEKRKLDASIQSLAAETRKIRIRNGLEKPKRKTGNIHVSGLGYSNHSIFRADDKDFWPYRK